MAGLKQEVDALFNAMVNSGTIRYISEPNTNAGINIVSDGAAAANAYAAYVQIAAALANNPEWIVGLHKGVVAVEAFQGQIAVAIGGAGAEVDYAIFGAGTSTFAVVEWFQPTEFLPFPIMVAGAPRCAARIRKSTAASAAGHNTCHVIAATTIGT